MKDKIEYLDVATLPSGDDDNPRKIANKNLERLKKSIKNNADFFEARPILLNRKKDGTLQIVGGHQRLRAARELGLQQVPCYTFDGLDDETVKRYMILDNSNEGAWDFKKLNELAVNIDLSDFNVKMPETIDYNRIITKDVLNAIIYKPSETPASVDEFFDNSDYDKVRAAVEGLQVPEELREFVQIRLNMFRRYRFDKIADYYARADENTRLLLRQLACVFDISGTTFERDLLNFYSVGLENPEIYEDE